MIKKRLAIIAGTQLRLIAKAAQADLLPKDERDTLKIVLDIIKLGAFSLEEIESDIEELTEDEQRIVEGLGVSFPNAEKEE